MKIHHNIKEHLYIFTYYIQTFQTCTSPQRARMWEASNR